MYLQMTEEEKNMLTMALEGYLGALKVEIASDISDTQRAELDRRERMLQDILGRLTTCE